MTTAEELLRLLPVHVRARDEEEGGLLRALLGAVAGELTVLEEDLDDLYEDFFVETAAAWALPYLADLLGIDDLPAGPGRRAVVAHTMDYRRRKGTPAVVEQVARDVTGWPSRAVEYLRLLVTSTHLNHVRLERPAVADVRRAADLGSPAVARGSLDAAMHTAEVRRIEPGRGRHGIANIGVFCFPHQVYAVDRAPARPVGRVWALHPLGLPTPLFAVPTVESSVEHLATEADLAVPLRPRRLLALLDAARRGALVQADLPIEVTLEADDLAGPTVVVPERLRVCGLEDLAREPDVRAPDFTVTPGDVLDGRQVMVDVVTGRLSVYRDGVLEPADSGVVAVHTRHAYGGTADIGAGTYDRADVHDAVLASDPYVRARPEAFVAQHEVRHDSPAPGSTDPSGPTLAEALVAVAGEWLPPALPGAPESTAGSTTVVSLADNGSWAGDVAVTIPPATRLVLVAAHWPTRVLRNREVLPPEPGHYAPDGLRPHVRGTITVTGGAGSSLVVDGLLLEGDLVVTAGDLGALTVSQSSVTGALRVNGGAVNRNNGLEVRLVRSAVGDVLLAPTVPLLRVVESIVSVEVAGPAGALGAAVRAPGAHLVAQGSTVRGDVDVRTLQASDCLLDGEVTVAHRQTGCLRYSFAGPGSRVPRRFRCVPASDAVPDAAAAPHPVYVSDQAGSPSFLALAQTCPVVLREGAEGGDEMGAGFHLHRPSRLAATRRLLAGYVPMGLEIGMVRDG